MITQFENEEERVEQEVHLAQDKKKNDPYLVDSLFASGSSRVSSSAILCSGERERETSLALMLSLSQSLSISLYRIIIIILLVSL